MRALALVLLFGLVCFTVVLAINARSNRRSNLALARQEARNRDLRAGLREIHRILDALDPYVPGMRGDAALMIDLIRQTVTDLEKPPR